MGLLWLLNVLQQSVPDKFTRERSFRSDGESVGTEDDDDDLSFVDPWNAPLTYVSSQQRRMMRSSISTMADIQKNIGELPKRLKRKHWPWETVRRKVLGQKKEIDKNNQKNEPYQSIDKGGDDSTTRATSGKEEVKDDSISVDSGVDSIDADVHENGDSKRTNQDPKKNEKQLCIGSIFGLDVGGTLAKLVYFEKKALELDPLHTRSMREKHYAQAVSAQTVLMAGMNDNTHAQAHSASKRSSSMSPMRKFSRAVISERSRVRSSTAEELEISEGLNPAVRHTMLASTKGSHHTARRNTSSSLNPTRPIRIKDTQLNAESELDCDNIYEEEKEMQKLPQHESVRKHFAEDTKNLYAIRQESLPDDVREFRHAIGFRPTSSYTEKMHYHEETSESQSVDGTADKTNFYGEKENSVSNGHNNTNSNQQKASVRPSSMSNLRKRSISMLDLTKEREQKKAEALNRFYDFARRLDMNEDSISDIQLSFYCRELGGEFHFISFETRKMQNAMDLIRFNNLHLNIRNMGATGGGAHKFADAWERELAIGMIKQDELDSLVAGMQFVLSTVVGECFTFRPKIDRNTEEENPKPEEDKQSDRLPPRTETWGSDESKLDTDVKNTDKPKTTKRKIKKSDRWTRKVQRDTISYSSAYPYMLVTIGTGVSVLRVDGPRKHERVSGSTIGGGTFWGLMRLLTDVEEFEDAMKLAEKGDPTKVDMMVGDIYGEDSDALEKLGLAADIVASSFGKLVSKEDPAKGLTQEDLARALLSLVTNNIGQVAYLNAKLHNTPRIYFVGSFLRHNMISQRRLSYAIDYWSKGEMEALFLEHEGYFGALGAFLMTQNIEKRYGGFFEWKDSNVD